VWILHSAQLFSDQEFQLEKKEKDFNVHKNDLLIILLTYTLHI